MNDVTAETVAAMIDAGDVAGLHWLQADLTAGLLAAWDAELRPAGTMTVVDVPEKLCACDDNVTGAVVSIRRRYAGRTPEAR